MCFALYSFSFASNDKYFWRDLNFLYFLATRLSILSFSHPWFVSIRKSDSHISSHVSRLPLVFFQSWTTKVSLIKFTLSSLKCVIYVWFYFGKYTAIYFSRFWCLLNKFHIISKFRRKKEIKAALSYNTSKDTLLTLFYYILTSYLWVQ